jgi:hypothetical protein
LYAIRAERNREARQRQRTLRRAHLADRVHRALWRGHSVLGQRIEPVLREVLARAEQADIRQVAVVQLRRRIEEVRDQPRAARRGDPSDVAPRAAVPDRHLHTRLPRAGIAESAPGTSGASVMMRVPTLAPVSASKTQSYASTSAGAP